MTNLPAQRTATSPVDWVSSPDLEDVDTALEYLRIWENTATASEANRIKAFLTIWNSEEWKNERQVAIEAEQKERIEATGKARPGPVPTAASQSQFAFWLNSKGVAINSKRVNQYVIASRVLAVVPDVPNVAVAYALKPVVEHHPVEKAREVLAIAADLAKSKRPLDPVPTTTEVNKVIKDKGLKVERTDDAKLKAAKKALKKNLDIIIALDPGYISARVDDWTDLADEALRAADNAKANAAIQAAADEARRERAAADWADDRDAYEGEDELHPVVEQPAPAPDDDDDRCGSCTPPCSCDSTCQGCCCNDCDEGCYCNIKCENTPGLDADNEQPPAPARADDFDGPWTFNHRLGQASLEVCVGSGQFHVCPVDGYGQTLCGLTDFEITVGSPETTGAQFFNNAKSCWVCKEKLGQFVYTENHPDETPAPAKPAVVTAADIDWFFAGSGANPKAHAYAPEKWSALGCGTARGMHADNPRQDQYCKRCLKAVVALAPAERSK